MTESPRCGCPAEGGYAVEGEPQCADECVECMYDDAAKNGDIATTLLLMRCNCRVVILDCCVIVCGAIIRDVRVGVFSVLNLKRALRQFLNIFCFTVSVLRAQIPLPKLTLNRKVQQ